MRRVLDRAFTVVTGAAAAGALALLALIVVFLATRGLPALSFSFLTEASSSAGIAGGVRYQLLGTLILVATALALAIPPALALALLVTVYVPGPGARRRRELGLYALNGVPSVVFGIAGLLVFGKYLDWGKSWLAGGILLALMILPTLTVALVERIDAIPGAYLRAAAGLGLTRAQRVRAVILPQSFGGLVSGALLGLARAAGETAPILFAAAVFDGATLPRGIRESPVLALPYHIFVLAQDALEVEAGTRLWAASCVLLALVLLAALLALPVRLAAHEEARRG